ncbi:MAG: hypothetical protein GXP09_12060 [Gammaproteobacteria bacterium]|nr:hypothetical protein [Gammaproteobacteria bacterium]
MNQPLMNKSVLVLLALVFLANPGHADSEGLERIDALVKGGASNLALSVLEAEQPDPSEREAWVKWEQRRFDIYVAQNKWAEVDQRLAALPKDFPVNLLRDLLEKAADAALDRGDGAKARVYLRKLLWQYADGSISTKAWRTKVIKSYLVEDLVADASIAMERYRKEFKPRNRDWHYLHARVLLRAGKPADAAKVVSPLKTFEGRFLKLLAKLRSTPQSAATVIKQALALAKETRKRQQINIRVWAVLAEAAKLSRNNALLVQALEKTLLLNDRLFEFQADDLWAAYEDFGEEFGNQSNLLIGDDKAWFAIARKNRKRSPTRTRAIYALIGQRSQDDAARAQGHYRLLKSLYNSKIFAVAQKLYMESSRYPERSSLPVVVRYYLSDKAFRAFNIKLAAELVEGLDTPPPQQSEEEWALRRARLSIYAGNYQRGLELLDAQLQKYDKIDGETADRVLPVMFDLQAAKQHIQAYEMFARIFKKLNSKRLQREVLFWMAESQEAQAHHKVAAELYLRSAKHRHPSASDMWAQTARFNAAQSLAKAGLVVDAESVYRRLLAITGDPKRRATIERNLKHLWLLGPSNTTP